MKKYILMNLLALLLILAQLNNAFAITIFYTDLDEVEETVKKQETTTVIEETTITPSKKENKANNSVVKEEKTASTTTNNTVNTTTKNATETPKKQATTATNNTKAAEQALLAQIAALEAELNNSKSINAPVVNNDSGMLNPAGTPIYGSTKNSNIIDTTAMNSNTIFNSTGKWEKENGFWVFYNFDGIKLKNSWLNYNNNTYYLDDFYHMSVGWKYIDRKWYYFNKNGEMQTGWLQLGENEWYYLNNDGVMVNTDTYIDGKVERFNSDGKWVQDASSYDRNQLADYVYSLTKFVNNKNSQKTVSVNGDYKKEIKEIYQNLPKDVLSRIIQECSAIYICMNQGSDGSKEYLSAVSYKDDDGERSTEYLPYSASKKYIYINGANKYNLYYGIANFLTYHYKFQGDFVYNTSVWKVIHQNNNGELDELMSLTGDHDLIVYIGDERTSLTSAMGWYLMDPILLQEANPTIFKFIAQFLGRDYGTPDQF